MQHIIRRSFSTSVGYNPVLHMYREMLRLAQQLTPQTKATDATQRIRQGFRENKTITSETRLNELLKETTSRLNFLRMVAPHRPREAGTFIVQDGKVVGGKADALGTNGFLDKRITDEQIKRHRALWRKQRELGM